MTRVVNKIIDVLLPSYEVAAKGSTKFRELRVAPCFERDFVFGNRHLFVNGTLQPRRPSISLAAWAGLLVQAHTPQLE